MFSFKTLIFFSVYFYQFGTRLFEAKALLVMEGPEITGRRKKSIPMVGKRKDTFDLRSAHRSSEWRESESEWRVSVLIAFLSQFLIVIWISKSKFVDTIARVYLSKSAITTHWMICRIERYVLYRKFNDRADKVAWGKLQKLTKWPGETDHFKSRLIMESFRISFSYFYQFSLKCRLA